MKKIGKIKNYKSNEVKDSYVSIGFEGLDRGLFRAEKCYDLLEKTGVKYARCHTGWVKCEKEKGVYDFAWLDSVVDNLLMRGIQPWFTVGFGNPLYMPGVPNTAAVGCVPLYYGDEVIEAWKDYIAALTNHFKDKITHYEIWNEPDNPDFWYPEEPDGEEYARLVNITAKIIHEVQTNAKTGACVCTPYKFEFIEKTILHLDKDSINFFSFHAYSRVPECNYIQLVSHMRHLLNSNGFMEVELWQGEAGYPSWAYEGHWMIKEGCNDERAQAVWQLRRYFLDIYNGIKRSSFFQMADYWERPYEKSVEVLNKPAAHGILNGKIYTPKESYKTITNLASIFSGDIKPTHTYMNVDSDSISVANLLSCQTMTYRRNNTFVYAYYLPLELGKVCDFEYNTAVVISETINSPILIDTYTGDVYEVEEPEYRSGKWRYSNLPLKDYPLVLTDSSAFEIYDI